VVATRIDGNGHANGIESVAMRELGESVLAG
jgi:hypothetical protein